MSEPRKEHEDSMGTNVYSANDNKSLHKSLNGEFMLYQILLQRILDGKEPLDMNNPALLNHFKPEDKKDKNTMFEFDATYKPNRAIHWYTRETCVYKILNKALRTQNIDDIVPFGQFTRDLNKQLSQEHETFIKKQKNRILKIYRGQFISKDELTRLKSGKGQLIAMNSFLSTSTNRKKALEFATSRPPPTKELTSILLEININLNTVTRPFADIKHLSAISEEEEILFMFGCVFRIDKIRYDEQVKLWIAKFTLCSQNDEDLKEFTSTLEGESKGNNSLIEIGTHFIHMLKFNEAEEHFQKLLDNNLAKSEIERAYCYHGLSQVNIKKGEDNLAIKNIKKSLNYLLNNPSLEDHPLLSLCYNDLGLIYSKQSNHSLAFQYFNKALTSINNLSSITYSRLSDLHFKMTNYHITLEYLQKCLENQPPTDYAFIVNTYIQMGKTYTAMNLKEKATEMFNKATHLQLKQLPPDHPDIGYTYSAIGLMNSDMNDKEKSFEYIEKAHKLQIDSLPSNHPDFGETYKNFADLYMKQGDLDKASFNYKKLMENQLKSLSWNHPSVIETYRIIGNLHWKKGDYDQASTYLTKLIDSQLTKTKSGDPSITETYTNIADLNVDKYNDNLGKNNLNQALDFYLKALQNELQRKLLEDFSLIILYKSIATIYYKLRILDQALIYYNRVIDCYLRKQPNNQTSIEQNYVFIGKVYLKKRYFDRTLLYYQKIQNQVSIIKHKDIDNTHFEKRHLDQSLHHFEKYLNKQLETHSEEDPLLAKTYYILANISFEKQNLDKALKCFFKLLDNQLYRKSVDDSSLINTYKAIATIYFQENNFNQSLIYFNRLIDSQLKKHRPINDTYTMIGKIYLKKNPLDYPENNLNKLIQNKLNKKAPENKVKPYYSDLAFERRHLDEALHYFENLINKQNKNESLDDIYAIIGNIALERQDLNQSLNYFQTLINIQLKKYPQGDPSLANTYLIVANIYSQQGRTDQALQNSRQSLSIYQQIDSPDPDIIHKIQQKIRHLHPSAV